MFPGIQPDAIESVTEWPQSFGLDWRIISSAQPGDSYVSNKNEVSSRVASCWFRMESMRKELCVMFFSAWNICKQFENVNSLWEHFTQNLHWEWTCSYDIYLGSRGRKFLYLKNKIKNLFSFWLGVQTDSMVSQMHWLITVTKLSNIVTAQWQSCLTLLLHRDKVA